jgi:hypothetical protein
MICINKYEDNMIWIRYRALGCNMISMKYDTPKIISYHILDSTNEHISVGAVIRTAVSVSKDI